MVGVFSSLIKSQKFYGFNTKKYISKVDSYVNSGAHSYCNFSDKAHNVESRTQTFFMFTETYS